MASAKGRTGDTLGSSALSTSTSRDDFRDHLLRTISNIKVSGSFASFGKLSKPPPAGLFIEGIGDLTMPLSESQASQLITKARQAPYGKGSETIVDTSVRNTWELDSQQFTFTNRSWPGYLASLCKHIAEQLGINATIHAEIYKMLIYEEGAMFRAHTDTEKIPGMFGTLVISLPSPHEGGEVVVKHCGKKKVFKTSEAAQSFICWYSDVSHEVRPVTSGYRWVLTYNLAIDQSQPRPSATLQRSETRPLRDTLNRWLAEDPESREQPWVYHVLDHDYTEANISIRALKAQDLARVQALKETCSDLPVEIFLALLEKSEFGSCEFDHHDVSSRGRYRGRRYWDDCSDDSEESSGFHGLEEVFETNYTIKTLVALDGRLVADTLHLDEEHILKEKCFEDIDAEEEYEGYMGNSGPTATHWYRIAAVAIVPHDEIPSFFNCDKQNCSLRHCALSKPIGYFSNACLRLPTDSSMNTLVKLCEQAWQSPTRPGHFPYHDTKEVAIDGQSMESVLKVALQNRRYPFFETAAANHQGLLPVTFFASLRHPLQHNGEEVFNSIKKGLRTALYQYTSLADQVKAMSGFAFAKGDPMPDYIVDWARESLQFCLERIRSRPVVRAEGAAMVDLASYFTNPSEFLATSVVPIFKIRIDNAAFSLGFLNQLHRQATEGALSGGSCMSIYQTMVDTFIASTDFTQMRSEMGIKAHRAQPTQHAELCRAVSHEELANFFSTVIKLNSGKDIAFISKLVQSVPQLKHIELHFLWLPFLRALIPILASNSIPLDNAPYQRLFRAILTGYRKGFVGHEPINDKSLALPKVNCSCEDCQRLNNFLTSSRKKVGRFAVNKQRRMHLHQSLDAASIDCTHETERRGSPQTLVVTKTFKHHDKIHEAWENRLVLAIQEVELFDQDKLKLLLGSDYSMVVNMANSEAVQLDQTQTTRQLHRPLANTSPQGRSQPAVAGQKRKLPQTEPEVIDLTGD